MFIAIDGKLYRYKGYLTSKPELAPEYTSWADVSPWTPSARVFVENTVLPISQLNITFQILNIIEKELEKLAI